MPFARFVQIGRVALVNYGPEYGSLVVITDVIDQNRVRACVRDSTARTCVFRVERGRCECDGGKTRRKERGWWMQMGKRTNETQPGGKKKRRTNPQGLTWRRTDPWTTACVDGHRCS